MNFYYKKDPKPLDFKIKQETGLHLPKDVAEILRERKSAVWSKED